VAASAPPPDKGPAANAATSMALSAFENNAQSSSQPLSCRSMNDCVVGEPPKTKAEVWLGTKVMLADVPTGVPSR